MSFEHSSRNYLKVANELIEHIRARSGNPIGRKQWTEQNLDVLRSFSIEGATMSWYPLKDDSKRSGLKGQYLWDYMGCTDEDVILIAESEWLSKSEDLKHDFEKLLYTRCPIKLMMCGLWSREAREIADELRDCAKACSSNFGPGEVFILYCVGWSDQSGSKCEDKVYRWQIPGEVASDNGSSFKFEAC